MIKNVWYVSHVLCSSGKESRFVFKFFNVEQIFPSLSLFYRIHSNILVPLSIA